MLRFRSLSGLFLALGISACSTHRPESPSPESFRPPVDTVAVVRNRANDTDDIGDLEALEDIEAQARAESLIRDGERRLALLRTLQAPLYFATGSDELDTEALRVLTAKARILLNEPGLHLWLVGSADPRGGTTDNYDLAYRRALRAKSFLVHMGVAGERLRVASMGEEGGDEPEAWARSRRVDFAPVMNR